MQATTEHHEDPPEETPWAMQVIVDVSARDTLTHLAVLEAVAVAVATLRHGAAQDEAWREAVSRWERGLIRKIVRRAKNAKWDAVQALDGVTVAHRGVRVRALVPSPMDAVPAPVPKLQVSGFEVEERGEVATVAGPHLAVCVNPAITASTGKVAAQVAHAAHVAHLNLSDEDAAAWAARGFPIAADVTNEEGWAQAVVSAQVHIHDKGFTEVPPGTKTVVASWSDSEADDR